MSKLLRLKEWVTLQEAARHLSLLLEEPVAVHDLLQLALEGHITLSVNLVNHARAKIGRVMTYESIPKFRMPSVPLPGEGYSEECDWPDGLRIDGTGIPTNDTQFIHFEKQIISLAGLWDLAMLGNERIDIEFELQRLTGGPEVELTSIDGTFLKNTGGVYASLQEQFPDEKASDPSGKVTRMRGSYYPAGGLPGNAPLVIRTTEIENFIARQSGRAQEAKPLGERERNAHLRLIGAMLVLLKAPRAGRVDDSSVIRELIANYGELDGISESGIARKFAEAKRLLDS